jgi:hypothetical protein
VKQAVGFIDWLGPLASSRVKTIVEDVPNSECQQCRSNHEDGDLTIKQKVTRRPETRRSISKADNSSLVFCVA